PCERIPVDVVQIENVSVVAAGLEVPHVAAEAPLLFGPRHASEAEVPSEFRPADALRLERGDVRKSRGVNREDVAAHRHPPDAAGDVGVETLDASEWRRR